MKKTPTIWVTLKEGGTKILINETDFDTAKHDRVRARLPRDVVPDDPVVVGPQKTQTAATGGGLDALSQEDLRALADELGITKAIKKRETLVEKIREARATKE